MTSYDNFYQVFIDNCRTEDINLPSFGEQQINAVTNAIRLYNNRIIDIGTLIVADEINELVDRVVTDNELMIVAHFIRLVFLKNQRTYKNTVLTPFTKEMGVRNVSAQINSLKDEIKEQETFIESLIFNAYDNV